MTISAGDWTVFFTRPISATILVLALLALAGPKLLGLWQSFRVPAEPMGGDA
jgi:putative tricarboxylic transport membrane protein